MMKIKSLHIIRLDKIYKLLSFCTSTDEDRELAMNLKPDIDIDKIEYKQTLTAKAKKLMNEKEHPSLSLGM